MSGLGAGRRDPEYRVGILARENGPPRKVAWMTAGPGGISIGVARATGWGMRYSYRADGTFYRSLQSQAPAGTRETQELIARHPPISAVKGLVQLLSVETGAGDRLRGFPFKRKFESVYLRPLNGKISFKLGLLEPGVPEALDTVRRKEERHFRLITKTKPWILLWNVAGFEAPPASRAPSYTSSLWRHSV